MALPKIPDSSTLVDKQLVNAGGPDGSIIGYQYDQQTKILHARESQIVIPSFHGVTHIGEDPIPSATSDTPGLMSASDKAKLDSLLQTRVGILGFQGAGFASDGGWLNGDIILSAGSEFISLERFGNVVRFTVDNPVPFNCACEACAQIYWIQDETDVSAIRPPTCAGKLPGINSYGEAKFYLFPKSTVVDLADPAAKLSTKGNYPALIFKRYENSATTGLGEFQLTLQRDSNNLSEMAVGWAFTPGASGVAECQWYMGTDSAGNRMRFNLNPNSDPGLLGGLLYKGHLLTKSMAIITDYTPQTVSTNQYKLRHWDVYNATAVGSDFTATNCWGYDDALTSNKAIRTDKDAGLLEIGSLVDLWYFEIGSSGSTSIKSYFFIKEPTTRSGVLWDSGDAVEFGDTILARDEDGDATDITAEDASITVDLFRTFERDQWGLTGVDMPLIVFEDAATGGPTEALELNQEHRANVDIDLPGLVVSNYDGGQNGTVGNNFKERPVYLWNRRNRSNILVNMEIGRPEIDGYPPYDILLSAPVDSYDNVFMRVKTKGNFITTTGYWIELRGAHFRDLPNSGTIRIIDGSNESRVWNYTAKMVFAGADQDSIVLSGPSQYPGVVGDVVELVHQEYNGPCVRLEFIRDGAKWKLQFKVGILDMASPYETEETNSEYNDFVRDLEPGYAVSSIYIQDAAFTGVGTQPAVNTTGFVLYDGGEVGNGEFWNNLEIMYRDGQVWIWWNDLLIPPNSSLNSFLDTPVIVTTPYFPATAPTRYGKFAMRLWPGAKVRRASVKGQLTRFSEFSRGQLEIA